MLEPDQEPDFDTIHGTSLTDPSKPLVLYWNRRSALERLKRFDKWDLHILIFDAATLSVLIAMPHLLVWITGMHSVANFIVIPCYLTAVCNLALMIWAGITSRKNALKEFAAITAPVMDIRPDGLSISCPTRHYGPIPWDQIKEVKPYSFSSWRYVRIVLKSKAALEKYELEDDSASGRSLAHLKKGLAYRLITARLEPAIDVPEHWLPLSVEEVIECLRPRLALALTRTDTTEVATSD